MGANTSKIDDDIIALDEYNTDTEAIPSPATTLTPRTERLPPIESRETIRSQARQIRHWDLLDGSDDLYESRRADQACHGSFAASPSPHSHAVPQICRPQIAQTAALPANAANTTAYLTRPSTTTKHLTTTTLTSAGPTALAVCTPAKRASSPVPHHRKKRRLMITPKAVEIASLAVPQGVVGSTMTELFEEEQDIVDLKFDWSEALNQNDLITTGLPSDGSNQTEKLDQKGFPLYQDEDFNFGESFDDEGYQSFTTGLSDSSEQPADEQEEQLVRMLAAFKGENISVSQPTQSADASTSSNLDNGEQDDTLEEARQWMLREQEAGAERSRKLREQAIRRNLQRGQILGSSTTSPTMVVEDDDSDMGISEDEVNEDQSTSEHDEEVLPFTRSDEHARNFEAVALSDEPDPEELLDVVQQHLSQHSQPEQSMSGHTLKYVEHADLLSPN